MFIQIPAYYFHFCDRSDSTKVVDELVSAEHIVKSRPDREKYMNLKVAFKKKKSLQNVGTLLAL